MKNTLISKQEAFDAMNVAPFEYDGECRVALKVLENLPEVSPFVPAWNAYPKYVPDEAGEYLVTRRYADDRYVVDKCKFGRPEKPDRPVEGECFFFDILSWQIVLENVIAWMPCPEAYRGEVG